MNEQVLPCLKKPRIVCSGRETNLFRVHTELGSNDGFDEVFIGRRTLEAAVRASTLALASLEMYLVEMGCWKRLGAFCCAAAERAERARPRTGLTAAVLMERALGRISCLIIVARRIVDDMSTKK